MNRRRAITVFGAAAFGSLTACKSKPSPIERTFSSIAFGTGIHFEAHGISATIFDKAVAQCSLRIREIESLFSLYDQDSAISRLNRDGKLENPQPEFLKLVRIALDYSEKTGGIFDITVQPLWNNRQEWKEASFDQRKAIQASWQKALTLVDFRKVIADEKIISFAKPGMAITLNGIVQGYATSEIAAILKEHGIDNALVDIGEYTTLGTAADGKFWTVELAANGEKISLPPGRALAVSAGGGHTFDSEGRYHHIFKPSDGTNPRPKSTIIVTAPTATEADALSTTFTVASGAERKEILRNFPHADFREIR